MKNEAVIAAVPANHQQIVAQSETSFANGALTDAGGRVAVEEALQETGRYRVQVQPVGGGHPLAVLSGDGVYLIVAAELRSTPVLLDEFPYGLSLRVDVDVREERWAAG